jgi:hypothetical protein
VTSRLTVRHLININPDQPRTSTTAAPRKPQHHRLWSPRSESKSFFFLKRAHVLTVKFHQPSHEFTFGVGMTFISYALVLTPLV